MSSILNNASCFNSGGYQYTIMDAKAAKEAENQNKAMQANRDKLAEDVYTDSNGNAFAQLRYSNSKTFDILDLKNLPGLDEMLKAIQKESNLEATPAAQPPKPSLWKQGTESDKSYYSRLGQYLGLNATTSSETDEASSEITTKADFLEKLRVAIKSDAKGLQNRVDAALKKNKIQLGKQDRMTFHLDSKGELLIRGIKDQKALKKVRAAIQNDPKLVDELKTLAAKQNVHSAVESGNLEAVMKNSSATRTQLTKNYLQSQGNYSLEDMTLQAGASGDPKTLLIQDEKLQQAISAIGGLDDELVGLLDTESQEPKLGRETAELVKKTIQNKSDKEVEFAYKNGVIMNDTVFDQKIVDRVMLAMATDVIPTQVDENGLPLPEAQQLRNYSVIMQADGKFRIAGVNKNIKTENQDTAFLMLSAQKHFKEKWESYPQEAVDDILMKHQYDYGDVLPTHINDTEAHPHEVQFSVATGPLDSNYDILSTGAEKSAKDNLSKAVVEFGTKFTEYVGNQFQAANPNMDASDLNTILAEQLPIGLNQENGTIQFDASSMENKEYAQTIDKAVRFLNERIQSDDPLADENFDEIGDEELMEVLKIMMDIKHNLEHLDATE